MPVRPFGASDNRRDRADVNRSANPALFLARRIRTCGLAIRPIGLCEAVRHCCRHLPLPPTERSRRGNGRRLAEHGVPTFPFPVGGEKQGMGRPRRSAGLRHSPPWRSAHQFEMSQNRRSFDHSSQSPLRLTSGATNTRNSLLIRCRCSKKFQRDSMKGCTEQSTKYRSPGESRDPLFNHSGADWWVPAFAGTAVW